MPVSSYVGQPLSDGNTATTFATVKPASTAAASTDTALVVTPSPVAPYRAADTAGQSQYNFPAGFVRTTDEPRQVFYDPFDAALDTTNVWTAPTTGNSAVAASVTTGTLSLGTGTTASGWSKLFSIPAFKLSVPAWLGYSFAIALPDGAAPTANAYRFWGAGTPATTPTTAAPMTDAAGFELTTAGRLCAVVYANGTRTLIADLGTIGGGGTGTQPADALMHRYIVYVRTDRAYWYIDSLATPVATSTFQAPAIQTLPVSMLAVGGSTPPASNTQIQCTGLAVWDTGKNSTTLSDGNYPWRKATIKQASTAVAAVDSPIAVGLHPSSPLPAGTNALGSVTLGGSGGLATVSGTISATAANTPGSAVTASTTAQVVSAVPTAGNVTFHLVTSAFVGTLIFEASVDAGLNYSPVMSVREDGTGAENTTAISTAAAFIRQYTTGLPGMAYFRVRCSAFTSGTVAVLLAPGPFLVEPTPSLASGANQIGTLGLAQTATNGLASGNIGTAYLNIATVTQTTLVAAQAGLSIYVTDIVGSNAAATVTTTTFYEGTATTTPKYVFPMAAAGGGFTTNMRTPWKIPANTALSLAQSAANQGYYTVNYYIAL